MMDSMPTPVYDIVRSNFLLYIEDDGFSVNSGL